MKYERGVMFKCDNCSRNITNKRHIRILLGWTSGWMAPPFTGGLPVASVVNRRPEFHFCKIDCFSLYFISKLNEIRTDTGGDERKNCVSPISWDVLEEVGSGRPRVSGEDYMGARSSLQREEGERSVGNSMSMLMVTPRSGFSENNQRMDCGQSNDEEGRNEVPKIQLETKAGVSKWIVWAIKSAWSKISNHG